MTGKIDRPEMHRITRLDVAERTRNAERPTQHAENESHVAITDTAQHLVNLERAVTASSGIDSKQVEHIADAIARGDYMVDSERIADAFIRHALQWRTLSGES